LKKPYIHYHSLILGPNIMDMYYLKNKQQVIYISLLICALSSCTTIFQPTKAEHAGYRITESIPGDSSLLLSMRHYKDSVDRSMNAIIGTADQALEKRQPQSSLGNFMADAMFHMAREKYGVPIDAAFVNYGGIRITQLAAGPVTRGKIFEVMPFDNLLILQQVKGSVLQQFLDLTAEQRGWPVAGITMQIKNKKAVNVKIGGQPLDPDKIYTIANSDYVANGGDNANMLKAVPQQINGYLMRDAIFDYIKVLQAQGKNISVNEDNRVSNAQ
jgi:2',3'-cyclic-nucleotide 2'-phosphodiesterase (5'-nucleotidase family)